MKIWNGDRVSYNGLAWTVCSVDNLNWDGTSSRLLEIYHGRGTQRVSRLVQEKEVTRDA